ncbi:dihydroorotate dehydrogenase electron transfer subunit [Domibacillus enclensis]|uniref:Dihydroorotate dehydrogenase B (NAD(+)), electron transfer subunit n=1 Tax=Domibacillus enclensis TaxID=1017273 RepID=A0A1N6UCL3_9BACI|nr:dihydroorotate dehydrogenase electron transfer subunit [Domibacillus enclensis]OXS78491.1 dihydroorotate dehydrogenase electron transfer subunit [Domibacillus enclensis]SIQ63330.1 dihydroorotate oxidase B, electron transfer subunit [Domibacillus enclensis]
MIQKELMTVVSQSEIAKDIFEMTLKGALVEQIDEPGKFVHLKASDEMMPLLRRPISIARIEPEKKEFTMIYRSEGAGTKALSRKRPGDAVDVLGPLGHGFPLEEAAPGQTALLIGGGIGVPPLYELSRRLNDKGVKTIHVLGFQNESVAFYADQFAELGETYVATVDGSLGEQGFVTDVVNRHHLKADVFYSCGPTVMLKAVEQLHAAPKGFISLEERMGCGIGACFACVCHPAEDETGTAYLKICSDGPVFKAGEVAL